MNVTTIATQLLQAIKILQENLVATSRSLLLPATDSHTEGTPTPLVYLQIEGSIKDSLSTITQPFPKPYFFKINDILFLNLTSFISKYMI